MNKEEARQVLLEELKKYEASSYEKLRDIVDQDKIDAFEVIRLDTKYYIKIMFYWDSGKPGNIRVIGNICSDFWSAFRPLSADFIMRPDGTLVK